MLCNDCADLVGLKKLSQSVEFAKVARNGINCHNTYERLYLAAAYFCSLAGFAIFRSTVVTISTRECGLVFLLSTVIVMMTLS